MSQPHYQIFVSSTFQDLKDERQAVLNAILKLNQFPAAMEIFPAVNDTAWEHIEKVIKDSDYYVLIIGGKYGSIDSESGLSYTEKEYDFAVPQKIPVYAFTHSDEESIPIGKSEINSDIREKLQNFKQKVGNKHHWNYWKNLDELKANVITSLSMAFVMNPQKGWVKAGEIDNIELLSRLVDLQKRYDNLLEENNKLKNSSTLINSQDFAFGDDIFEFKYDFFDHEQKFNISWYELFILLGEFLSFKRLETDVKGYLVELIIQKINEDPNSSNVDEFAENNLYLYESNFNSIRNQFLALELFEITELSHVGTAHPAWQFTEKGRKLFLNSKAIRKIQDK